MQDFQHKFQLAELTVRRDPCWVLSVRPQQTTLGSLVLSLSRSCNSLAELTAEETRQLAAVFRDIEQALHALFAFDKINYLALMMVDSQVHMHILPRYQQPRDFAGITFTDLHWPGPVTDFSSGCAEQSVLRQIQSAVKTTIEAQIIARESV